MTDTDLLVTGANGFVGYHVTRRAESLGWRTARADIDLRDADAVTALVAELRPSAVAHLAASPLTPTDAWAGLRDDIAMLGNVLRAVAASVPEAPVLVPGSAAQYGRGLGRPLTEADPMGPLTPYGACKVVLEVAALSRPLGCSRRVIWARAFNHFGPGQDLRAPIAAWADRIARLERAGGGILETGRLDVVRDFLDVRDVASAYLRLLEVRAPGVVVVASGVPRRLSDVVATMVGMSPCEIEVRTDAALLRRDDPESVVGDPRHLHDLTGWTANHDFGTSLSEVLEEWRGRGSTSQTATTPEVRS